MLRYGLIIAIYIGLMATIQCTYIAVRGNHHNALSCEALWCIVGSTLAFGSIGHGFESEHRLFSHRSASAFSALAR